MVLKLNIEARRMNSYYASTLHITNTAWRRLHINNVVWGQRRPKIQQLLHFRQFLRESNDILAEAWKTGVLLTTTWAHVANIDLHMQKRNEHFFDNSCIIKAMM